MRSVKPSVISAGNAVTLSKLQLKVLMGITADVDIKIDDSLAAYEGVVFANQLDNAIHEGLVNNTTMKQLELNRLMLQKYQVIAYKLHTNDRTGLFLPISIHE